MARGRNPAGFVRKAQLLVFAVRTDSGAEFLIILKPVTLNLTVFAEICTVANVASCLSSEIEL
jgi:hypothetical protein